MPQNTNIADKASYIRSKREKMGLSLVDFAILLDMKENGERTVRGWESGEHVPSKAKFSKIEQLTENAPLRHDEDDTEDFTFIDLFAGIGGIRYPFQKLGGKCVFSSEWDKFAQKTYAANFGEVPHGDITQIKAKDIYPNEKFDLLLAGFPCQTFSQAGLKRGFHDTRGTMFFEIQRILVEKRPKAFLLENVKQLQGHNKGETLKTIMSFLKGTNDQVIPVDVPMSEESRNALSKKLNYWVDFKVLRAADFGKPQNRARVFIVGFDKDYYGPDTNFDELFSWPEPLGKDTKVDDILERDFIDSLTEENNKYTISDKLWFGHQKRKEQHKLKGNGFGCTVYKGNESYTNTLSARYYKDGSEILIDQSEKGKTPRKLTPRECANLQGFPKIFIVNAVSHGQIYKQFGNSVCVTVVEAVAQQIRKTMVEAEEVIVTKIVTKGVKSLNKTGVRVCGIPTK